MAEKDLKALFVHQLKDTYFAENAILKALPQMVEAAQQTDQHHEGDHRTSRSGKAGEN